MNGEIQIIKATLEDAEELTKISRISFDDDTRRHGIGHSGGPPGYNFVRKQKLYIENMDYYKFIMDSRIVGGMFLKSGMRFAELSSEDDYYIIRIFIHPNFQNKGIGSKALRFVEAEFPQASTWTLDTPHWAIRNHHFYEKMGYTKVGEKKESGMYTLYLYEKKIDRSRIKGN